MMIGIHEKRSQDLTSTVAIYPIIAMTINKLPKNKKVRYVPISGINTSTGKNVPKKDPIVEIAESFPDTFPTELASFNANFIANGDTYQLM